MLKITNKKTWKRNYIYSKFNHDDIFFLLSLSDFESHLNCSNQINQYLDLVTSDPQAKIKKYDIYIF